MSPKPWFRADGNVAATAHNHRRVALTLRTTLDLPTELNHPPSNEHASEPRYGGEIRNAL
jgi:hypothetical protein